MAIKKYHRTVDECCTTRWFKDAEHSIRHRENGPAIQYADGTKFWFQNGQCHRTDGPAIEWSYGTKSWCQNGQYHRTDGPAIERADGYKFWYIDGVYMTKAEFLAATQPTVEMTIADIEKPVGKRVEIIK